VASWDHNPDDVDPVRATRIKMAQLDYILAFLQALIEKTFFMK
jgi:hypothetical protein